MNEYLYLIPIGIAFFLAFNMGASGVSPSFSAAWGANLISREAIPGLFGIFVLAGGLLAGQKVMGTIGNAILPSGKMNLVIVSIILMASALSLLFANLLRVPQSTSQSTVLALAGAATYFGEFQTRKLFLEIVPMWFVLPVIAFVLTFGLGKLLKKVGQWRFVPAFQDVAAYPGWRIITVACSCYVAFSIGSNNVGNAAGPIGSLLQNDLGATGGSALMLSLLCILLVAPWFGIGGSMLGGRVLATTGRDMIEVGPLAATLVSVITASLLLLVSTTRGIPASLVQMNTFSLMAIGFLRQERGQLQRTVVIRLWATWLAAPAIAFTLSFTLAALASRLGVM